MLAEALGRQTAAVFAVARRRYRRIFDKRLYNKMVPRDRLPDGCDRGLQLRVIPGIERLRKNPVRIPPPAAPDMTRNKTGK